MVALQQRLTTQANGPEHVRSTGCYVCAAINGANSPPQGGRQNEANATGIATRGPTEFSASTSEVMQLGGERHDV